LYPEIQVDLASPQLNTSPKPIIQQYFLTFQNDKDIEPENSCTVSRSSSSRASRSYGQTDLAQAPFLYQEGVEPFCSFSIENYKTKGRPQTHISLERR
jgi:hypothetical protein